MKDFKVVLVIAFMVIFVSAGSCFAGQCSTLNLVAREMSIGDITAIMTFRVDVRNSGKAGSCSATVQGVDEAGFEVVAHTLRGEFSANETKTLTDVGSFLLMDYKRVKQWRLK